MNEDTKYNLLMWSVTLVAVAVLSSLGVIALMEREIFVSWRTISSWSRGIGAEIIGWLFFGAATAILSYQLKTNKFWFMSYSLISLYFIALAIYVFY